MSLTQHQLFERREPSLQFTISLTQLVDLVSELRDLNCLLLELIRSPAQLFDRCQTHTGKILHADRSIAGAELKGFEEIFSHRSHVAHLATFSDVVPRARGLKWASPAAVAIQ